MKISVCAFLTLYVGLTSERNIPDLSQIKTKSLDILEDNEINSADHVHNVNRKVETFLLNNTITKHKSVNSSNNNRNHTKLKNYTTAHTLQNYLKNGSVYEHAQDKQNDINERSFVFIDTKYKVPFHHQNMLRMDYKKSINRDYNHLPHAHPWDSHNYKESPKNFVKGSYKEEPPLKLYVDSYTNPSTAYVQSYDDYYKVKLNNALSQELRHLEKKVKAADALIDYHYQKKLPETYAKDSLPPYQENYEYFHPETIMMKNKFNQHVKNTDVLDRYKSYGHPHQMLPNDYRDNIFDQKKHKSEFHNNPSMTKFKQPENNKNYFPNDIRGSNDHVNEKNNVNINNAHLGIQPYLQSNENDFVENFDHDDTYDPLTNNNWMGKNHMSYAQGYDQPDDSNSDGKYLKNIHASDDAQKSADKSLISSLKYHHLPKNLKNEINKSYLKNNALRKSKFDSAFVQNKSNTLEQNKTNYKIDNAINDQSRKSFYLTNKLPPNYDDTGDVKYSPKTEQANYKHNDGDNKRNHISSIETVPGTLNKNNYLREKYRPNMEPNLQRFTEEVKTKQFQNIEEKPAEAPVSYKLITAGDVITQDDNPTIEIQHPDSKNNFFMIKFHPKQTNDSSVIKIHPPKFSRDRIDEYKDSSYSNSYKKVTNDYKMLKKHPNKNAQSVNLAGKSIEIYPKLNEIYSPSKNDDLTDGFESTPNYQQNMEKEKVYKAMQHHVINKPPPPDLTENEVTLTLQQKDNVFKQLDEKINEINDVNSNNLHLTSERTEKIHDDCMMNTLIRRITNKSVVVTPKPFRESCVYPECMENAILNSDPNNPTCECEYAIKQNMSKNSDYGELELPVPVANESSGSRSH